MANRARYQSERFVCESKAFERRKVRKFSFSIYCQAHRMVDMEAVVDEIDAV